MVAFSKEVSWYQEKKEGCHTCLPERKKKKIEPVVWPPKKRGTRFYLHHQEGKTAVTVPRKENRTSCLRAHGKEREKKKKKAALLFYLAEKKRNHNGLRPTGKKKRRRGPQPRRRRNCLYPNSGKALRPSARKEGRKGSRPRSRPGRKSLGGKKGDPSRPCTTRTAVYA